MKILRCKDISPMYCPEEVTGETVEEIIEKAKAHGRAAHGLANGEIPAATIALWQSRVRDVT
ncbi:MAG: DUF1059 domain-containing protein [Chloroflexota bacterium]